MEVLGHILACVFVVVGCFEYAPTDCTEDVFFAWEPVPCGEMPAHCDGEGCLPLEWEDVDVRRRFLEGCAC